MLVVGGEGDGGCWEHWLVVPFVGNTDCGKLMVVVGNQADGGCWLLGVKVMDGGCWEPWLVVAVSGYTDGGCWKSMMFVAWLMVVADVNITVVL